MNFLIQRFVKQKNKNGMKKGTILISFGLLLIVLALSLTVYNIWDEKRAGQEASEVLEKLTEEIDEPTEEAEAEMLYQMHPDMEIPTIMIDGNRYIGVLEIPALDFSLPIMESWSYPNLKHSPCRYEGSAYSEDLIIAGHDYRSHFGLLKKLQQGDQMVFTDVDGNQFVYEVAGKEVLAGTDVEEMKSGDWDMTLFTCTYSGRTRMTIRCELISSLTYR